MSTVELTPTEGLPPSVADALLNEMQETTHEVERRRRSNGELLSTVAKGNRRLVRMETRLVRLMEHFGLDADGTAVEPD